MTRQSEWIVGLHDSDDVAAGRDQRVRDREQERPGARDHDAPTREHAAPLDECLGAASGHHTRESPPGEGKLAVEGACCDHGRAGVDFADVAAVAVVAPGAQAEAVAVLLQRVGVRAEPSVDPARVDELVEGTSQGPVGQP